MSRKLPSIPQGSDATTVLALAKTVQFIVGQRDGAIEPLATTATTAQIIDKINEILARLQGT